jgi:hypothetical protein
VYAIAEIASAGSMIGVSAVAAPVAGSTRRLRSSESTIRSTSRTVSKSMPTPAARAGATGAAPTAVAAPVEVSIVQRRAALSRP